jgi:LAS superfamily LD-carboxypeptidase LdcB
VNWPVSKGLDGLLVGKAPEAMVVFGAPGIWVHPEAASALTRLVEAAAKEGLKLEVASGFRDFDRQVTIWNQKARGERPLLDASERTIDPGQLSQEERVFAILRWSALPGASRHHWGTDVDVFDRAALPPGASPQLRREETVPGGIFGRLHGWLDVHARSFGFYRPYAEDKGGVCPEPWHLSYAPVAQRLQAALSVELLESVVRGSELELKETVLKHLHDIYDRFVVNVDVPSGENPNLHASRR